MIVQSMSSLELTREVYSDFEIVQKKIVHIIKNLRREVVKSKSKYVHRIFDYKTNKYNNWKIIVDYSYKNPKSISLVYYNDCFGLHGIRVDGDSKSLTHFTPHFLARYNERFVKLSIASKVELLVRFIDENFLEVVKYIETGDPLKRDIFCKFKDGVGFGDSEYFPEIRKEIIHFRTFVTDKMLFQDQLVDACRMNTIIHNYLQEHRTGFQKRA